MAIRSIATGIFISHGLGEPDAKALRNRVRGFWWDVWKRNRGRIHDSNHYRLQGPESTMDFVSPNELTVIFDFAQAATKPLNGLQWCELSPWSSRLE